MKMKALLYGLVCMMIMQLSELNVCALARKQLTQVSTHQDACNKCAPLDDIKRDQESIKKVVSISSPLHKVDIAPLPKDHANSHQYKKSIRRTLSQKHKYEGKKERFLSVDEVDYAGPRTHPPTKPPKK